MQLHWNRNKKRAANEEKLFVNESLLYFPHNNDCNKADTLFES